MTFLEQFLGINTRYYHYSEYREKKKEYYKERNDIKSYNHFYKRVDESMAINMNSFNAPVRIKPFGFDFGVSKQEVILELGKPDYVLVETGLDHHQVIYYKKRKTEHSYLLQIHFINNKMVYAMNVIKNLASKKEGFFMKITSLLLNKYLLRPYDNLDSIDCLICDEFDNRIVITEILGLNIRFISGNREFMDFLKSRIKNKKTKKENTETTNINNLFVHL